MFFSLHSLWSPSRNACSVRLTYYDITLACHALTLAGNAHILAIGCQLIFQPRPSQFVKRSFLVNALDACMSQMT